MPADTHNLRTINEEEITHKFIGLREEVTIHLFVKFTRNRDIGYLSICNCDKAG